MRAARSCVWRGHIKGEHIVATVHGDDITIAGEGSAVELKKYEIKKQDRVIEWNCAGITIEGDQRHAREDTERS